MKMYVTIMVNKDKQHRDEFIAKISNDKEYQQGYEEQTSLFYLIQK